MPYYAINKPKGFVKLAVALASDDTTLIVRSGDEANLPSNTPFTVTFENEVIYFDTDLGAGGGGYQYIVQRDTELAYGSAPAAAHAAGTPGENLMTAGTLANIYDTISGIGVSSSVNNNFVKNGRFINNSTNGYGFSAANYNGSNTDAASASDNWLNSNANPVQGGFRNFTLADIRDLLGLSNTASGTGDLRGLWNLNGDFTDKSANSYTLTASGSPANSSDGLMAQAKDFEAGTSDYASISDGSSTNLEISGSQTWFAWIKLESIPGSMSIMSKLKASNLAAAHNFAVNSSGNALFNLEGLTTNDVATSDIVLSTGKWYFICGVYDSSNTKLKIWVNGVKKEVTATGSAGDSNAAFAIGANFNGAADAATDFFDGLIQNAGVLSVALSDDQVKRLWAYTSWKGLKTRTAGGIAGTISQTLDQDEVLFLRGKTVTFGGIFGQTVTSVAQFAIDDGSESTSATSPEIVNNVETSVTKTISSTATSITLRLKNASTTSLVWWDQVRLNLGSSLLPFSDSSNDLARIPNLLKVAPIGNGYQYEEKRAYSYTPTYSASSSMTFTSVTTRVIQYWIDGNKVFLQLGANGTTGGVASDGIRFTLPPGLRLSSSTTALIQGGAVVNEAARESGFWYNISDTVIQVDRYNSSNFGLGANREIYVNMTWINP